MRVVKFKAWHNIRKEMYQVHGWHSGFVFKDTLDGVGNDGNPDRMEDVELIQFIEKQDTKGVDAYDGDIIRYRYFECNGDVSFGTAFIKYVEGIPKLEVINCDIFKKGSIIYMVDEFEIIGNIHSNPELL